MFGCGNAFPNSKFGEHKKLWGALPPNVPRGYGPAGLRRS